MSNIRIYVVNHSASHLVWQNFNYEHLYSISKHFKQNFLFQPYCRSHCPLPFFITFSDLDPSMGSQGHLKGKPLGFIFCTLFNLFSWNFMCWSKSSCTSWYYFQMRFIESKKRITVYYSNKQPPPSSPPAPPHPTTSPSNVGMHCNIHQPICFKRSMMIDTAEPYILILVYVTLTWNEGNRIPGNRGARKQHFLGQLFHKVFSWFEWNLLTVETCWSEWTSYSFYGGSSMFEGKNPTLILACVWTSVDQFGLLWWCVVLCTSYRMCCGMHL